MLANDVAAWGALALVWPLAVAPSHGSAAASPQGDVSYTPVAEYVGADAFSYTVRDGRGRTATCVVSVEVVAPFSGLPLPPLPVGERNATGVLDPSAALSLAALLLAQASSATDDLAAECGAAGSPLPVTMVACLGVQGGGGGSRGYLDFGE